jgi:twinkle protein
MKMVQGVDMILLDHISMVISGNELDERKELDMIMTKLATLCKETGLIVFFVVHLSRQSGKNYNEGGNISLKDLRGSAGIEQLSHTVIGLERDQQSEEKNKVSIRLLKNRFGGETGLADELTYNMDSGILETQAEMDAARYGFMEKKVELPIVEEYDEEEFNENNAKEYLESLIKETNDE